MVCPTTTSVRIKSDALNISKHTTRCIRSFSASSNWVAIQPWSGPNLNIERQCRRLAATNPGIPAIDSNTINRIRMALTLVFSSVYPVMVLNVVYIVYTYPQGNVSIAVCHVHHHSNLTNPFIIVSLKVTGVCRYIEDSCSLISFSVQRGCGRAPASETAELFFPAFGLAVLFRTTS
jgi:hypothetical protein